METNDQDHIGRLRLEVWKRAFGNEHINPSGRYCRRVSRAIEEQVGEVLHKDTIRNFLSGNNEPQPRIRDIYATFVMGGNAGQRYIFDDFILWVEEHGPSTAEIPKSKGRNRFSWPSLNRKIATGILFIASVILLGIVGFIYFPARPKPTDLFYRFTHSNLQQLKADGWFLFPDSIDYKLWNRYPNSGYLTLEAFPGDSFLENRDYKPFVINILAHAFDCGDCCEAEVKIVGFSPFQRYQQAGFYLFYEDEAIPSFRMCYGFGGSSVTTSAFIRDDTYSNRSFFPAHYIRRTKILSGQDIDAKVPLDSVVLKIRIQNSQYFMLHKVNDGGFIPLRSQSLDLPPPRYIGLAAFQGRPEIPYPVYPQADTIPAHFEYVRIKPCGESN